MLAWRTTTMTYVRFRDSIQARLRRASAGLTWQALRRELRLPYTRPCPEWVKALERDIGLARIKGGGRALVWRTRK